MKFNLILNRIFTNRTIMLTLFFYIVSWSGWFLWVQTIGRLPYGLSPISTFVFDFILIVGLTVVLTRKQLLHQDLDDHLERESLFDNPSIIIKFFNIAAIGVILSLILTCIFQIPFDWDGMDYHLPPIIESWQNQSWTRSDNPYFAARNYPKTAGTIFLWWFNHVGHFLGLRLSLIVPLIHWMIGLMASVYLFGRPSRTGKSNIWILLFWIAFPLVTRQATTAYADLPALTTLLVFCVFATRGQYGLAALSLGLHSSMKFTNIASSFGAILGIISWWILLKRNIFSSKKIGIVALFLTSIVIFAGIQPLENKLTEGRFFGPLQCTIFGHDFCSGSIDPNSLVVEPTLEFAKDDSVWMRTLKGYTPKNLVLGSDPSFGGFGFAWLLPLLICMFLGLKKTFFKTGTETESENHLSFDKIIHHPAMASVLILLISDVVIPAQWYTRYHMGLGMLLSVIGATIFKYLEHNKTSIAARVAYFICIIILFSQIVWLIPQRTWFLGIHSVSESSKLAENIGSIMSKGTPSYATHPADVRSIDFYDQNMQKITVCGKDLRPSLPLYGRKLQNQVSYYATEPKLTPCPSFNRPPSGEVGGTNYWMEGI